MFGKESPEAAVLCMNALPAVGRASIEFTPRFAGRTLQHLQNRVWV